MVAELVENKVIVKDAKEGNRIYNKGCFGTFNGKLNLHLIEACYLLEKGRISIEANGRKIDLKEFMEHALNMLPDFEIKYLVYRDLRERGYVVRVAKDFLLYERGKRPPAKPAFLVKAISERRKFKIKEIEEFIEEAENKLIIGIVDEEGDLTYYLVKFFEMKGKIEEKEYKGEIVLLNDRCIVFDKFLANELKKDFIGRDFGKYVQLSLMEAGYLAKRGAKIKKNDVILSLEDFMEYAKKIQPDIEERLKVYEDLRKLQLLPKTGFKFGTHFRVYDKMPEETHAPYLIHVVNENYEATWAEISRAIRLAHSVKKEMIFCIANNLKYIRLRRVTP